MKKVSYTMTKIALNDYEVKTLREAVEILCNVYNQAPEDTELEKMVRDVYNGLDTFLDEAVPNSELDTEMCWIADEYNETEEQAQAYSFSFRLQQSNFPQKTLAIPEKSAIIISVKRKENKSESQK